MICGSNVPNSESIRIVAGLVLYVKGGEGSVDSIVLLRLETQYLAYSKPKIFEFVACKNICESTLQFEACVLFGIEGMFIGYTYC